MSEKLQKETDTERDLGCHRRLVSLANDWRRLANSWIAATANIPRGDHVRDNAETRAQAYRDCAQELDAISKANKEL